MHDIDAMRVGLDAALKPHLMQPPNYIGWTCLPSIAHRGHIVSGLDVVGYGCTPAEAFKDYQRRRIADVQRRLLKMRTPLRIDFGGPPCFMTFVGGDG